MLCGFGNTRDKLSFLWHRQGGKGFGVIAVYLLQSDHSLKQQDSAWIFYSDLHNNDQIHFSWKDTITSTPFVCLLWLPPLSSLLICLNFPFPLLGCIHPIRFLWPLGTSRLPAGRTRQPLGIPGWQPGDGSCFPGSKSASPSCSS